MNERLIKEDQLEYQEELRAHYKDMLSELSAVMNEQVSFPECDRPSLRMESNHCTAVLEGLDGVCFLALEVTALSVSTMLLRCSLPYA